VGTFLKTDIDFGIADGHDGSGVYEIAEKMTGVSAQISILYLQCLLDEDA